MRPGARRDVLNADAGAECIGGCSEQCSDSPGIQRMFMRTRGGHLNAGRSAMRIVDMSVIHLLRDNTLLPTARKVGAAAACRDDTEIASCAAVERNGYRFVPARLRPLVGYDVLAACVG
jgi:hypothetical protein